MLFYSNILNIQTFNSTVKLIQTMSDFKQRQRKHSLVTKTHREKQNQYVQNPRKTIDSQGRSKSSVSIPKLSSSTQYKPSNSTNPGGYLIGWGNIQFAPPGQHFKMLGRNVLDYAVGDQHLVFVNNKNEAYGMGKSSFGQLSFTGKQSLPGIATPLMSSIAIKNVFCGPYTTFLITDKNQIYACGMNNRGQLGINSKQKQVAKPVLVQQLSTINKTKGQYNELSHRKHSATMQKSSSASKVRPSSIAYDKIEYQLSRPSDSKQLAQRIALGQVKINQNTQPCQQYRFQTQDNCSNKNKQLLIENQCIVSISPGMFHTVALSNKGRVFYTGNLYSNEGLKKDECITSFVELNLKALGKMTMIKSSLTSVGMINDQGCLFLMGLLSQNLICDQPSELPISSIIDFSITDKHLYTVTKSGDVFLTDITKLHLKTSKMQLLQKIKSVHSSLDFTIFVTTKNGVYGMGDNSDMTMFWNQGSLNKSILKPTLLNLLNGKLIFTSIKPSPRFVIGLCQAQKLPSLSINNQKKEIILQLQEIEKENQMLKMMLSKKQKKLSQIEITKSQTSIQPKSLLSLTNKNSRTFDNSLQIPFSQLKLGKMISQGGYGIIYKAEWRKTTVAVKIFKIDQNNQNSIKDFISQCRAMQVLRHPNIVMFLGVCSKPPNFAIVLEYCEGGTLWSLMQGNKDLSWQTRRNLALDTAKGMNYLHSRSTPILHRDLKSLNLLLDGNQRVKLADFGWTKGLQNYMTGKIGTYQWMAPEVVSAQQYTQKADVFSFGIILWEIASRQPPYRNIPGSQVAHDVLHKQLRPTIPKKTPECFGNLMKRCWHKNPQARPNFNQIIQQLESMPL